MLAFLGGDCKQSQYYRSATVCLVLHGILMLAIINYMTGQQRKWSKNLFSNSLCIWGKKKFGRLEENNGSGKTHSPRVCQLKSYNSVLNSSQLNKEGRSSHFSKAYGIHILVLAMKLHKLCNIKY